MQSDRGILLIAFLALAWGGLANACRRSADDAHVHTVDSLITTVDAAILTLNELDPERFDRAAMAYAERERSFGLRFQDTLDRNTAEVLGNQYLGLRAAPEMAIEHKRTLQELHGAAGRLRTLRTDVMNAAMDREQERNAIEIESRVQELLRTNVERTIDNYRTIQRTDELMPLTDSLLAVGANTDTSRIE